MLPPNEEKAIGWHPAPEFWSANRAEQRFVDGHQLIAFDLPVAGGFPAEIGWELFGGVDCATLIATGHDDLRSRQSRRRGSLGRTRQAAAQP